MRILHVVPTYLPAVRYGGPIYSVHGLAKASAALGHDVHVFTTNVDGPGVSDVPLGVPVDRDGVKVWYFATGAGRRLYRSPAMARALARQVGTFDILHLHSVFLWPTLAAARSAQRSRTPYLVAPRGMLVGDLISAKSRWLKSAWITLFERATLARAAAVHVTSRTEQEEIERLGLRVRSFRIVPNGIDLPPAAAGSEPLPDHRRYVLSLGRVNWKKGLDRLIRAMADVPDADLVIAGNDEEGYRARLQEIAGEAGVIDRVRFVGAVHGARKWSMMRAAAVFALASYSENFGNAVLEAMACGVPVVVTPEVGLAGEVAACGAGLVAAGDPPVLAAAISALLADPAKAAAAGRAGRRAAAETYSWTAVAAQMDTVYRDHVKPSSSGAKSRAA